MTIIVQPDQTLADIGLQWLGDPGRDHEIAQLNELDSVRILPAPGSVLEIPDPAPEKQSLINYFKSKTIATSPGDLAIGNLIIGLNSIQ